MQHANQATEAEQNAIATAAAPAAGVATDTEAPDAIATEAAPATGVATSEAVLEALLTEAAPAAGVVMRVDASDAENYGVEGQDWHWEEGEEEEPRETDAIVNHDDM